MRLSVPWAIVTMRRLYSHVASVPMRYTQPIVTSARIRPEKSGDAVPSMGTI